MFNLTALITRLRWRLREWRAARRWAQIDAVAVHHLALPPFDWLTEYGPHWHPDSTAFWLEPRTQDQLRAWMRRYRPAFVGEIEAAGLKVVVAGLTTADWFNVANQYSNYQSQLGLQQQMSLQNALMNSQYGLQQAKQALALQALAQNQMMSNTTGSGTIFFGNPLIP